MQCPNCEADNRDDARFCDECGFPLGGSGSRGDRPARKRKPQQRQTATAFTDDPYADPFAEPAPADAYGETTPENSYGYAPQVTYEEAVAETFSFDDAKPESPAPHYAYDNDPFEGRDPFDEPEATPYLYDEERPETQHFGYSAPQHQDAPAADFTMEIPRYDRQERPQNRDFRVVDDMPQRGRGKIAVIIGAGIAVGVIIAIVVTFALGLWGGVAIPDVTGMTEADATSTLNEAGFAVRTTQVKSDETEGLVLITDPQAGSRAAEGSEVVIHIATTRFVPDIVGKSSEEAKALINDAGYENVRYEKVKSDGDEDVVLSVSPDAGTRAKSNTEVVVKVSEAYRVPSIEGLDLNAAMSAISDAGLTPDVAYVDTDQYEDGTIIGTTPESGAKVAGGEYVAISVARARGAELVKLTESLLASGNTVTIGGVDYEMESVTAVSYLGDDSVSFTATGRPKITFFGETLYASSSQTVSGTAIWSADNELISIG